MNITSKKDEKSEKSEKSEKEKSEKESVEKTTNEEEEVTFLKSIIKEVTLKHNP